MNKYPFFIIIDDGGFDYAVPGDKESKIGMETYYNILRLAKEFGMKIPICFTMKYLDKENISGFGKPLEYIDELIDFLKVNSQHLEIGYHGLTHQSHPKYVGEFFYLDENKPVPLEIQKDHIVNSKKIFDYWNLKFPEIFVPPAHAWKSTLIDKILSDLGIKYLISKRKIVYKNKIIISKAESKYLKILFRNDLGIYSNDCNLDNSIYKKHKFFVQEKIINYAKRHIIPRNIFTQIYLMILGLPYSNETTHSYMTHIGNFTPNCYNFWKNLLTWVKNNTKLHLCGNNYEAVKLYSEIWRR